MAIFSSTKEKASGTTSVVPDAMRYSEDIAKIHDEFRNAGERLYQEALAIINGTSIPNEDKAKRLMAIGFSMAKDAVAAREAMDKKRASERVAMVVKYYRDKYPLYKFILDKDVDAICEKYGLIHGKVSGYIGFVPEKNLREIEAFSVDVKDRRIVRVSMGWGLSDEISLSLEHTQAYWREKERERERDRLASSSDIITPRAMAQMNAMQQSITRIEEEFSIAAPMSDFKLGPGEEVKGRRIVAKVVPDPVVLCAVAEGYLIVTAWGDEASDPLVQNELNN
jgi:hypothetical protein